MHLGGSLAFRSTVDLHALPPSRLQSSLRLFFVMSMRSRSLSWRQHALLAVRMFGLHGLGLG